MAISVSGAAALAPTTKLTAADATHVDSGSARGHFIDPDGQHVSVHVRSGILEFSIGGQQALRVLRLSQQNSNDVAQWVVSHANTGAIS
jgi:hypothetical protein